MKHVSADDEKSIILAYSRAELEHNMPRMELVIQSFKVRPMKMPTKSD
jgi:hypothetical protein